MNSPSLRQYDYQPNRWQCTALFVMALSGFVLLVYFACATGQPVNALGIQLDPHQARMLFGGIAALSSIGLFCLGAMVYDSFTSKRRIALTGTHVILPRPTRFGLSRDDIEIPLDTISEVSEHDFIGSTRLLRINYRDGVVNIPSNMIRDRRTFDEMCKAIGDAACSSQSKSS